MLATFILRLVPAALEQPGALVGRVECVETGQGKTCRHIDEFIAFARAQSALAQLKTHGDHK